MKFNIFLFIYVASLLIIHEAQAKRRNATGVPEDADDVDFLPIPKDRVIFYPQSRVVGGSNSKDGQFPHQISLRISGTHMCGGSIISANYVVTAAHCVTKGSLRPKPVDVSRLSIRAGSIEVKSGGQVVAVASITSHPSYRNFNNDIAVLKLAKPLQLNDRVKAIALATQAPPAGAKIEASGWGRLRTSGPTPQTLQFTTLTALSNAQCRQRFKSVPTTIICLDHPKGKGVCNGDSGGPAVYQNQLVGVANYVVGGCASNFPDGFANVAAHYNWIKTNSDL